MCGELTCGARTCVLCVGGGGGAIGARLRPLTNTQVALGVEGAPWPLAPSGLPVSRSTLRCEGAGVRSVLHLNVPSICNAGVTPERHLCRSLLRTRAPSVYKCRFSLRRRCVQKRWGGRGGGLSIIKLDSVCRGAGRQRCKRTAMGNPFGKTVSTQTSQNKVALVKNKKKERENVQD